MTARPKEYLLPFIITIGLLIISAFLGHLFCSLELGYFENGINILNILLVFLLAGAFYTYLRELGFSRGWSNAGLFIMVSSMPIFYFYAERPDFTFDLLTYLIVVAAFFLINRSQTIVPYFLIGITIFVSYQAIYLFPILLAYTFTDKTNRRYLKFILLFVILLFWFYFLNSDPEYIGLIINNDIHNINKLQAWLALFATFGYLWVVIPFFDETEDSQSGNKSKFLALGARLVMAMMFVHAYVMNPAFIASSGFIGFALVIPAALPALQKAQNQMQKYFSRLALIIFLILFHLAMIFSTIAIRKLVPGLEFCTCDFLCYKLIGVNIGISMAFLAVLIVGIIYENRSRLN